MIKSQEASLSEFIEDKKQEKETMTYSTGMAYLGCAKFHEFRNIKKIVPINEMGDARRVGSNAHNFLELHHGGKQENEILEYLDQEYAGRHLDDKFKQEYCRLVGMYLAYKIKYPQEAFKVLSLEEKFQASLINPETNRPSQRFMISGKIDGLIELNKAIGLMEHKTTNSINEAYIKKVTSFDTQISLYSAYMEEKTGKEINQVLYNIIQKPMIKLRKNDTEESFIKRIVEYYQEKPEMMHREYITILPEDKIKARQIIWDITQKILADKRKGRFLQNPGNCFKWNRPCDYYDLCVSKENPVVMENQYKFKKAHSELSDEPVF